MLSARPHPVESRYRLHFTRSGLSPDPVLVFELLSVNLLLSERNYTDLQIPIRSLVL